MRIRCTHRSCSYRKAPRDLCSLGVRLNRLMSRWHVDHEEDLVLVDERHSVVWIQIAAEAMLFNRQSGHFIHILYYNKGMRIMTPIVARLFPPPPPDSPMHFTLTIVLPVLTTLNLSIIPLVTGMAFPLCVHDKRAIAANCFIDWKEKAACRIGLLLSDGKIEFQRRQIFRYDQV